MVSKPPLNTLVNKNAYHVASLTLGRQLLFELELILVQNKFMSDFNDKICSKDFTESIANYAYYLAQDSDKAKDLIQETYARVIEKQESFNGTDPITWAITIMKNYFYDTQKKKGEYQLTEEGDDNMVGDQSIEENVQAQEREKQVQARMHFCLKKLSNDDREIITYKQQDMPYERIANMLEMSVGNLRVRMLRAKESLRLCLQGVVA